MRPSRRQRMAGVARREIARTEGQRVVHGIVTAIDDELLPGPATTVAVGPASHPAYSNDTVAYAVGDKVSLSFNGRSYTIVGRLDAAHAGVVDSFRAYARYYRSADQSISTGTATIWDIDSVLGTDYVSSNLSGTGVVTVAASGLYLITVQASFEGNGTGRREVQLLHNGSQILREDDTPGGITATRAIGNSVCHLLNAGDTVSVQVEQGSGGPLNLLGGSFVGNVSRLTIVRLGAQTPV